MRIGEKAKEDKDEGRGENGARTVQGSGFGEKDGGGGIALLLHKLPQLCPHRLNACWLSQVTMSRTNSALCTESNTVGAF